VFGTVPGGGLDAYVERVGDVDEYAVVIPEGFFYLSNLVAKMVVLLQPLERTSGGAVVYPRDASFRQLDLLEHPYVRFRERDLLRAYFAYGDPRCALTYKTALPYQDRFVYLLVGVEVYLLAHEVAHVLLGHIAVGAPALSPEDELAADRLALRIVTAFFADGDHAGARAGLCGMFFHALNALWESTIVEVLGEQVVSEAITRHPPARHRLDQFVNELLAAPTEETPSWYGFELSALDSALVQLPARLAGDVLAAASALGGLSSRVMPTSLAHLGQFAIWSHDDAWWRTIAALIVADDPNERLLGRWFLLANEPWAAVGLYEGLVDDDEAWSSLCRDALVAVVPEYEHYLPRLLERFRETDEEDELASYLVTIAGYVSLSAMRDLGTARLHANPMQPGFFDPQS
jgi:hypothetical protein